MSNGLFRHSGLLFDVIGFQMKRGVISAVAEEFLPNLREKQVDS
jgi:hypothetical protein